MVVTPSIESLEKQVKELQSNMGTPMPVPAPIVAPTLDKEELKSLIKSILAESGLILDKNDGKKNDSPLLGENVVPNKKYSLLEAIGLALSKEDQIWLSNEKVLFELPNYIVLKDGQDIVRKLFTQFREFYENKEHNNS